MCPPALLRTLSRRLKAPLTLHRAIGYFTPMTNETVRNANQIHAENLSRLDRAAMWVTERIGSVGFFLIILVWTIVWTGYNIAATEISALGWKAFDPFPAFVAYLLISNVIQILLMPLIMVGQNLQGRHTETRAQLDFEINQKAEAEVAAILEHLAHNTDLILKLMRHLNYPADDAKTDQIVAPDSKK